MVSAALEFKCLIDEVFSTYIDSIFGYTKLSATVEVSQQENIERLRIFDPGKASIHFLDEQAMCYSFLGSKIIRGTTNQFKFRNRLDGSNWQWAARMFIITIYDLWECEYRNKIGNQKGLSKGQLELPIMGDIRLLRNWIIHCKSVPDKEVDNMKEVDWCSKGEPLTFDFNRVQAIVCKLKLALGAI